MTITGFIICSTYTYTLGRGNYMSLITKVNYRELAEKVINGYTVSQEEALAILQAPDEDLLDVMNAAFQIRKHYFGNKVKLNMIINAKSGLCPEDCGYCSQSIAADAPVEKYTLLNKDKIIEGAQEAIYRKAGTY